MTDREFNRLILAAVKSQKNRQYSFVSALAYVDYPSKVEKVFLSSIKGQVSSRIIGKYGFGFDPIFYLPGLKKTLGQLTLREKNEISPRSQSLKKFLC